MKATGISGRFALTPPRALFRYMRQRPAGQVAGDRPLTRLISSLLANGFPPSVSLAVVGTDGVVLESYGGYACAVDDARANDGGDDLRPGVLDQGRLHGHADTCGQAAGRSLPR